MTVTHVPSPPAEVVARTWAATTDDHWYRVDVQARALACVEAPDWMIFRFLGAGGLVPDEMWAGARDHLAALGFELLDVALHEITEREMTKLTADHAPAPEPERVEPATAGPLSADDFSPAPTNTPPRPQRRRKRRR